jgi:transposase
MKRKARRAKARVERRDLKLDDLKEIVTRAKSVLNEADYSALTAAVETLVFLTLELQAKGASIDRLRKLVFGASTEKTSQVFDERPASGGDAAGGASGAADGAGGAPAANAGARPKAPGHGRNGAGAYRGATKVKVPHTKLQCGAGCPECQKGKIYPLSEPAVLVRVTGMAPLGATVYECERLRCNLCGEVFTADAPAGVGNQKYDETAASMIGLLKYGAGLPFNRIEKLERGLGIPLPAATQWEVVARAAGLLGPAHEGLIQEAAQGEVLYNDDTTAKILELMAESQQEAAAGEDPDERTGVFTTGIVSTCGGHRIALFFTGRQHAGENLTDVLARRAGELRAPIQMCDALSRNLPAELQTVLANCMAHARRRFVDVVNDFPEECRYLLETLGEVYKNDALARQRAMSPDERFRFHQAESGPLMEKLATWLRAQIEEHKTEPNSTLGEAIGYMNKHWSKLTLFLRVPGAPLDNNICERALKKAILHRKNALFYKTLNGARVGDIFMGLIHSAEINGVDPFDYLVALQRHHEEIADSPGAWLPWTYKDTVARIAHGPSPPPPRPDPPV